MTKKERYITCDGNYAASHIAYMFSEVAAIYPITPSSTMAEYIDEWAAHGRKNIFNETVKVVEMQSEGGAAGAVHGSLQSGALTTTYTASQGLLLMIPNMYKMAGELLPAVFHVSARTLASQALSIFGDHGDIYAARQTGFAMLSTSNVQEIMDLAGVAHLAAIKSRIPFVHFFDGFRTSHEIQKVEITNQEDLIKHIDWKSLEEFRNRALNPEHPVTRGTAQNPDIFFQAREASNPFYDAVPDIVNDYMQIISKQVGREYRPFTFYGDPNAENIVVAMGSVTDTIKEVIDNLNSKGEKLGLITVHLYRPFSTKYLFNVLPKSVKRICVLDRTKEPGANGEPLYLDIRNAFYQHELQPLIIGGRYGLSSKDTTPAMIISVFNNLKLNESKNHFTVGIVDDVTFTSLPVLPEIDLSSKETFQAKFYGIGSDGTVGANKNSIKIIGDTTDKYAQAYFSYDSKKSGGVTTSHLRFGDAPIRSPYLVNTPDFVACHVHAYIYKYDLLKGLKPGGTFLLNSIWSEQETIEQLPNNMKRYMAENNIKFYTINATQIAEEIGLGNRTNTILQASFFKISGVIPYNIALEEMKAAAKKTFERKGADVVKMNIEAIERGAEVTEIKVDPAWKNLPTDEEDAKQNGIPDFIKNVANVMNNMKGDDLPVSAFRGREDGTFPAGTTAYEKRGIAISVPEWQAENCIQCNQCAFVCPHAVIRPFLLNEKELNGLPAGTAAIDAVPKSLEGLKFRIQISPLDCTGCGNCADVCPAKTKALVMKSLDTQEHQIPMWDYMSKNVTYKSDLLPKAQNVKNSQFAQPLFEFSGACAGCGETPYIKLITQLYGERMIIANATGCSSIYGGSAPSTPYTVNACGQGPAWANSLFEDNAEYGFGIYTGVSKLRQRIAERLENIISGDFDNNLKEAAKLWLEKKEDADGSKEATDQILPLLEANNSEIAKELVGLKQYFIKKSVWIFGGDGWAYDIGYGGLDHVLASGENVNVLVLDTEVYSNTGGQASKSTPTGAIAKFAASGKKVRKKDLGMMAMSYGYVYVAQVAMGANQSQYLKALKEAEAYDGPSLIIAYAPCINHGLTKGMGKTQAQQDDAVKSGYWHLYRYNPDLINEGKNPFVLDSKEPNFDLFQDFLMSEVRYTSLNKLFPENAKELFKAAKENAIHRYNSYKRLTL